MDECQDWFKQAMAIDEQTVKQAASDDPDLKPLWAFHGQDILETVGVVC